MNGSAWSWIGLVIAILLYWVGAASIWVLRQRRKARDPEPGEVTVISDTEIMVSFEEEFRWLPLLAVVLGPPLILVILFLG